MLCAPGSSIHGGPPFSARKFPLSQSSGVSNAFTLALGISLDSGGDATLTEHIILTAMSTGHNASTKPILKSCQKSTRKGLCCCLRTISTGFCKAFTWKMFLQASAQHSGAKGQCVSVILPHSDELQLSTHNLRYKRQLMGGFFVPQQDTEHRARN